MTRRRWLLVMGALVAVALIAVVVVLVTSRTPEVGAAQIATTLSQGGEGTNITKRGPQDEPDGYSLSTQYFITLDDVAAAATARAQSIGVVMQCAAGLNGLPQDDVRTQVWQSLPNYSCTVRTPEHDYGYVWLVEHSSGNIRDGGSYIGLEGDLYDR